MSIDHGDDVISGVLRANQFRPRERDGVEGWEREAFALSSMKSATLRLTPLPDDRGRLVLTIEDRVVLDKEDSWVEVTSDAIAHAHYITSH